MKIIIKIKTKQELYDKTLARFSEIGPIEEFIPTGWSRVGRMDHLYGTTQVADLNKWGDCTIQAAPHEAPYRSWNLSVGDYSILPSEDYPELLI